MRHINMWLYKLGNGYLPIVKLPDSIQIPPRYLYEIQHDSCIAIRESLRKFLEKTLPNINANFHAPEQQWISWIAERAMLPPKNSSVDQINVIISQELLPGEAIILSSADSARDPRDSTRFFIEFLSCWIPSTSHQHKKAWSSCSCDTSQLCKDFAMVVDSSLLLPPKSFSSVRSPQ